MVSRENHENYLYNSIIRKNNSNNYIFNIDLDKEFLDFYNYKKTLLKKYENQSSDYFKGSRVISNDYGKVLKITTEEPIDFDLKENNYRNGLKNNLKLVPGIGIKKESKLKEKGYKSLEDLVEHNTYCDRASETIESIENLNCSDLIEMVKKNMYSDECKSNLLKCASLFDLGDFKFMDIETMGLSNVPIILIGVAEIKGKNIRSTQYLVRDFEEEPAALEAFKSHLDENSAYVTFNGKYFDVPFIKNRLNYHRMSDEDLDLPHFDLLYYARKLWEDKLPNCQLQTIEREMFGIEREGDVPGQYIPSYYNTYLEDGNVGPLVPIVSHNRQDIVSLASFLMKMYGEVNGG